MAASLRPERRHAARVRRGACVGALIGVLAALVVSACLARPTRADETPAATAAARELRVGMATNYPPLVFDRNGALTGIEVELAKKLGKGLGVNVTLVRTPWDDLIPALRDHHIDVIMSGMSVTDERKALVSFAEPYLRVGQMALVRRADEQRFPEVSAKVLSGIPVGVVRNTTGEQYARKALAKAEVKPFASVDDGVAALRRGEIDVFVHDAPSIWRVAGGFDSPEHELVGKFRPLTEEYLAWAVRKDDGESLRAQLNAVLERWKADHQLDRVLDHWIRVRKTSIEIKPVQ